MASRITWDEAVIAEHDLERGTRQRIDEPKTPFRPGRVDGGAYASHSPAGSVGASPGAAASTGANTGADDSQLESRLREALARGWGDEPAAVTLGRDWEDALVGRSASPAAADAKRPPVPDRMPTAAPGSSGGDVAMGTPHVRPRSALRVGGSGGASPPLHPRFVLRPPVDAPCPAVPTAALAGAGDFPAPSGASDGSGGGRAAAGVPSAPGFGGGRDDVDGGRGSAGGDPHDAESGAAERSGFAAQRRSHYGGEARRALLAARRLVEEEEDEDDDAVVAGTGDSTPAGAAGAAAGAGGTPGPAAAAAAAATSAMLRGGDGDESAMAIE